MTRIDATNTYILGRDAAIAANIGTNWRGAVLGYLSTPNTAVPWNGKDWDMFGGNLKLPTWVAGNAGEPEAWSCLTQLYALGVPAGKTVLVDMETRIDVTYLNNFGAVLNFAGFRVWVYGSVTTVFGNPELNGYMVADWTGQEFMYPHRGVRATQYESDVQAGTGYDQWAMKPWEARNLWT